MIWETMQQPFATVICVTVIVLGINFIVYQVKRNDNADYYKKGYDDASRHNQIELKSTPTKTPAAAE